MLEKRPILDEQFSQLYFDTDHIGCFLYPTEQGIVGEICLQRPDALNAHTTAMNRAMLTALHYFSTLTELSCVLVTSSHPRAFCAGGDVRALREYSLHQEYSKIYDFFLTEYSLDWLLAHYPVPIISIVDGIAFGGGAGFAIHPRYTIVSEKAVFAMPEAAIGLYPDAGSSFFLRNLRQQSGIFYSLTGSRMSAADAHYYGLAQYCITHAHLHQLLTHVRQTGEYCALFVSEHTDPLFTQHCGDYAHIAAIAAASTLEDTLSNIKDSSWKNTLTSACPSSLVIAWDILHHNQHATLAQALARELVVSQAMVARHDFCEGVRAVLIDKDHHPHFSPLIGASQREALFQAAINPELITTNPVTL